MKIENILVRKVEDEGRVRAYVSFVLNGCFAIHDVRIIDGYNGLFAAMPSRKKDDKFIDVCHPITKEFRKELEEKILNEYYKYCEEV